MSSYNAAADPEFPKGRGANPQTGVRQKLHENQRNWTERRGGGGRPSAPVDSPLLNESKVGFDNRGCVRLSF